MDISIIILNYKSEHYLVRCLDSLRKHLTGLAYEIIVINNDESDLLSLCPANDLHIIHNQQNEGFAKACNKAANLAKGEILFFLNPDTEILLGNLVDLKNAFNDSSVGIVAPQLLISPTKIQPWNAGFKISLWEILANNLGYIHSKIFWSKGSDLTPDWVSGAALTIKKSLFENIQGFDENFFMYFEDVDLCKRVKEKSLTMVILPTVQVLHIGGQSASTTAEQKKQYYASQDYYFKKHFGQFQLFCLKLLRSLSMIF
ncbi:MAG: glycosyltransferase family 2 protein [Candidatus Moranbacteria bacterium]|nr:glycosyltransferase family 2 protein [Candidatus Moranbacteria bacterium]